MHTIIRQVEAIVGAGGVLTGEEVGSRSAGIWGAPGPVRAQAIVRPRTTEEVAEVLRLCHAVGQTVVVHGGMSNVVRSTISAPADLVLSLERMDRIEEIDEVNRTMTVQSGVILQRVHEAAEAAGLLFPVNFGARGSAQIGGSISTNAGGTQVIRYGMMRNQVLGLEAVLADGTVLSSLNKMLKNNAGYDLKQLFIGSEGTLGVVTRAVLRLRERPRSRHTAFVGLDGFGNVAAFLKFMDGALGGTLSAFEVMWRAYFELVTTPPAPHRPPLPYAYPFYVLVESLGAGGDEDRVAFENALEQAAEQGLIVDAALAQTRAQSEALWAMRDDVEQIFRYAPVFAFDVSLAIRDMDGFVRQVQAGLDAAWADNHCLVFGHLGDGNLHIFVTAGEDDEATRRRVEECVYRPLQAVGGSVSAEHGIGLEKKPYLSWCRSPSEIAVMKALKRTLDPHGILNPGKVFDLE